MNNKFNKIKDYCNKNKILVFIYLLTIGVTTISMFKELENGNIKNIILCLLSVFLYFVPLLLNYIFNKCSFKIKLPIIFDVVIILFIFSTIVLGEVNDFYEFVPIWDDILHIVQGFFIASIGFSLIYMLLKNKDKDKYKNKIVTKFGKSLIILFSLCSSISVGVIWEIVEHTVDCNINVDMQKDKYIYNFNSVLLNPKKNNEVMEVDKIGYTTIYDESGKRIVTFNGYLDIGLHDTMDDLIDTLIGALLFGFIGYLYLNNKGRYKFVEKILLKN